MANYYEILNIGINASQGEIKKNYRKKAKQCHPDMPNGNDVKFQKLYEAYQTLINIQKRKIYDVENNFTNKKTQIHQEFKLNYPNKNHRYSSHKKSYPEYRNKTTSSTKDICLKCHGLGKIKEPFVNFEIWRRCSYCEGSGLES